MQLTAAFLFVLSLSLSARTISQTVSISGDNVRYEDIFAAIRKQTGYSVVTGQASFDKSSKINVRANNMDLLLFMENILRNSPYQFEIKSKTIFIKRKPVVAEINPRLNLETPPITVRGRIVNEKGEPVIATIIIKGTQNGVVTDNYGNFQLDDVDDAATLIISGISIEKQEIKINGRREINITAVTKVTAEQEVVVSTGYFSSTKRSAVTNISRVDAKDIEKQPVTSPLMSLQGRMAGVDVAPTMNSGPGGFIKIQIRGQNSLRATDGPDDGNRPLYVIDGVPIDSRPIRSNSSSIYQNGYDPLAAINPANIENIQVLKDAAATAIYGSRGANGVVLITTKKGSKSLNTNFDISFYAGMGQVPKHVDVLNAQQYLMMRKEAFANDGAQPGELDYDLNGDWDTTRSTDWQKELLGGTAKIYDGQISYTGGNELTNFIVGAGFHKETSVINSDFGFTRSNMNMAVNHTSVNRKFTSYASVNYGSSKSNLFNESNFVSSALFLPSIAPALYDDNGNLNWQIANVNNAPRNTWINPLSDLKNTSKSTIDNIIGNATISYEILSGLIAKANAGFSQTNGDENIHRPISAMSPTSINAATKAESYFGTNSRKTWIIEPQLTYNKKIQKHKLGVVIGGSYQVSNSKLDLIQGHGYTSDALLNSLKGATSFIITSDNAQYKYIAGFGNIAYEYDNKYLLSVSGRRDGSSRFGPGKQYGNFAAVGAGWIFSNESWLSNSSLLSFGKIRGSYGTTGNDQIGDYRYYDTYGISSFLYQGTTSLYPEALFNPEFAWEITKKLELGIELGFLNNRISAEASWYRNRSSNQLVNYLTPGTTGFDGVFTNFPATVENTGLEIVINSTNVLKTDFRWTTSVNFTIPKNKLVNFPDIDISPYATRFKVGEPLSIQYLYLFEGIDPSTGARKFKDVNGDNNITPLDKVLTTPLTRLCYGGLNNAFTYKNFDLSFLFQFAKYWASAFNYLQGPGIRNSNQPVNILERWQKNGDITNYAKFSQTDGNATEYGNILNLSNANSRKIYFIRLKTLSLSYHLPSKVASRAHFQDFRVFLQGQNLWTLTDDNLRLDPETGFGLPPLRIINIGLQLKF